MHVLKLTRWMMSLFVIVLASGCGATGNYCQIAQKPYQWRSDAEIDATPIGPLRWIETEATTWESVCQ